MFSGKLYWSLSIFCKFFKLSIWISCFRALFGCKSGKNYVETYIYWVLGEITVMPHKKFQDLNINKSYFCKSDTNRRNFNWRSRYKNLFNVLNYIKHKLTKLRMLWTHFMRQKKGRLKCKHFIVFRY